MGEYRKLFAYEKRFAIAMEIYEFAKSFPSEEKYSWTGQIRRSSRSVCTNIVEAYNWSRYKDYFVSKLNDSETENAETQVWLDFSLACNYLSNEYYENLTEKNNQVAKLVWFMINNPEKFL